MKQHKYRVEFIVIQKKWSHTNIKVNQREEMLTCHTLIVLSEYPANSVWPSVDHAKDKHSGGSALLVWDTTSGFNSSTISLLSKSQILIDGPNAAHNQYLAQNEIVLEWNKHKIFIFNYCNPTEC